MAGDAAILVVPTSMFFTFYCFTIVLRVVISLHTQVVVVTCDLCTAPSPIIFTDMK
jgi:hypothetical protein